jgi:hypothetical protein
MSGVLTLAQHPREGGRDVADSRCRGDLLRGVRLQLLRFPLQPDLRPLLPMRGLLGLGPGV